MELVWTTENKSFVDSEGHALCLGGPGSGKTTMALYKANKELGNDLLFSGQRFLFLSFARATISRVSEQSHGLLQDNFRKRIEINTYHGFCWALLKSHGYLLTPNKPIRLLSPEASAAQLSSIENIDDKVKEKQRLFVEQGILDFDIFASSANELLSRSNNLRELISKTYPVIILDEFQDTNNDEWELIQTLGKDSRLIALADPEQRIYEFRGASPSRLASFVKTFNPTQFDLSNTNHRSPGTDISDFGKDLLTGVNRRKSYKNVLIRKYVPRRALAIHVPLKAEVMQRRGFHIKNETKAWSIAILVPTQKLMLEVSDYLSKEQTFGRRRTFPGISNEVAIDPTGPSLAAAVIGEFLSGGSSEDEITCRLISAIINHIKGRAGGKKPSIASLQLIEGLERFLEIGIARGSKRKAVIEDCVSIAKKRIDNKLQGNPTEDWLSARRLFEQARSVEVQDIGKHLRCLKFLNKGSVLRSKLSEIWRTNGCYKDATKVIQNALVQEHFSARSKDYTGIHVMTLHKSKGKQFTEVIIYEGVHQGRILRAGSDQNKTEQARLSLRVAVTRAEQLTTILTPSRDPCPFL